LKDLVTEIEEAEAAFLSGDWPNAAGAYEALIRRKPKQVLFKHKLARVYLEAGRFEDVVRLLSDEHLKEHPKTKRILIVAHIRLRDHSAALMLINELLKKNPGDAKLVKQKSVCEEKLSSAALKDKAAIEAVACAVAQGGSVADFNEAVGRYSNTAFAWIKFGTALADADRNAEAADAFRRAVQLSPEDLSARSALTRVLTRISGERELLDHAQATVDTGHGDFESYRTLGRYYFDQQNWPAALENLRAAVEISPAHSSTRFMVARVLIYLERYIEALDELKAVTDLGSKPIKALQLKADIYMRLARVDEAILMYEEALRLDPKQPLISHRLSSAFLLKGNIPGFNEHHEKRRQIASFVANNKAYPYEDWNGELSIPGKLLVWFEAGLGVGQSVLHLTFLRQLAGLGIGVVIEAEPRLVDLCRRSFPTVSVVASGGDLPTDISHHTPIGSLSRWFKPD
jgi:tetratricopeptide (TPR) repeat protein